MPETPSWYDSADPETVKAWETDLDIEVRKLGPKFDPEMGLIGDGRSNIFQVKDQLKKGPGDKITFSMRWQLDPTNRLKVGSETVEGAELGPETRTFSLLIDELRQGAKRRGRMAQQRVPWNIIEDNKSALADYFADQQELGSAVHLAGYSGVTDAAWNWNNTPAAPDADHITRVNSRANDQSLTAADKLNSKTLNQVIAKMKQTRPRMRPGRFKGFTAWLCMLHTNTVAHMRETDSDFFQLHLKALEGGRVNDNPIFTGNLGVYQGVVFMEDEWVPPGLNSSTGQPVANTRRNLMLGAGALCLGYGREDMPGGYKANKYLWYTKDFDAGSQVACYASTIAGMASPRFERPTDSTTVDYGKHVISSYAEDLAGQDALWTAILL